MSENSTINHEGFVAEVTSDHATVKIDSMSACASCHAKGACSAADQKEKILTISTHGMKVSSGDHVKVLISRHTGLKAVAYGYLYPFLLLMLVLITLSSVGVRELMAGILSLAVLLPYYILIYLMRKRIGKEFTFKIQKT